MSRTPVAHTMSTLTMTLFRRRRTAMIQDGGSSGLSGNNNGTVLVAPAGPLRRARTASTVDRRTQDGRCWGGRLMSRPDVSRISSDRIDTDGRVAEIAEHLNQAIQRSRRVRLGRRIVDSNDSLTRPTSFGSVAANACATPGRLYDAGSPPEKFGSSGVDGSAHDKQNTENLPSHLASKTRSEWL
jgi:hypothetical protein